jgi:2'-5' RNA ligase
VADKCLFLIATFDEETSKRMKEIERIINEAGIVGKQTLNIPHHITLASFDTSREEEINQLVQDVCEKSKTFSLVFNHIGLFGMKVLFLAPVVNYELLDLQRNLDRNCLEDSKEWTPHATILIDEVENIQKALPLVVQNFKYMKARVESVSLYEFFPIRFIAKYNLK